MSISGDDRHSIKSELDDFRDKPNLDNPFEDDLPIKEPPKYEEPANVMELRNQVFISKYDILRNEAEILGNTSEIDKRNKEFEDILTTTKVDQKH